MRKLRCFFVALLAVFMLSGNLSAAGMTQTVKITYNVDNESARSLFSLINDWRTGGDAWYYEEGGSKHMCGALNALTYDYDLEQIALQRAYEIAVSYSWKRPTGDSWNTCTYNNTPSRGENRAHGKSTASGILVELQATDKDYSFQTERRDLLSSSYKAAGIAHVSIDGSDFWVVEYGYKNSGAAATTALKGTVTASVKVDLSKFSLRIQPAGEIPEMYVGETAALPELKATLQTATVDSYGIPVSSDLLKDVTWTSSNTSAFVINNNKTITAKGAAGATLTASATYDGMTATCRMTVSASSISINSSDVKCTVPACYYTIGDVRPEPVITYQGQTLEKGKDYTITGYSNNIEVSSNAVIHIKGKGRFTDTRDIKFSIAKRDINDCSIYEISDVEYTGNKVTPAVRITINGMSLTEGTDYTLSSDSIKAGNGKATITGIGNFTGTRTASFKITKKNVSSLTVSSIPEQTFTGFEIRPSVTVKNGKITLKEGTDYTLSYSDNTGVTTKAAVVITGKGNYTGTKTVYFSIVATADFTWKNDSGNWYLYDKEGNMLTGWQQVDGKWYFLKDDGVMATGWLCRGEFWYYLEPSGAMVTGWKQVGSIWYYFENSGVMKTGWLNIGNIWYYLNTDGAMVTGWKQIGGIWYYFASSGSMLTGWQYIGSSWYYFESSGAMKTGWICSGGNWYYLQPSGAMATKWLEIKEKWYWFGTDGIMVYSTSIEIDGKTYNFDENGVCTNH